MRESEWADYRSCACHSFLTRGGPRTWPPPDVLAVPQLDYKPGALPDADEKKFTTEWQ